MTMLPVYVRPPNTKSPGFKIGEAPDNLTIEEVARLVGVPEGCLVGGRTTKRRKFNQEKRWLIVANVKLAYKEA